MFVYLRTSGGGLGGTRRGAPHENIKYSGRVDERYFNPFHTMGEGYFNPFHTMGEGYFNPFHTMGVS